MSTLRLLTDQPISEEHETDQDGLGFQLYAEVIGNAILGTPGPFTIGVFGEWGSGKTSLMRMIQAHIGKTRTKQRSKDSLPESKILPVWFNAWQFENEAHPIIPLVSTIIFAIDQNRGVLQKLPDSGKRLVDLLKAVAYGFSIKSKLKIPAIAELEATVVGKDVIEKNEKILQEFFGERSLYYEAFDSLQKLVTKTDLKIVVFIDDLDRCFPDKAIKLLEAIKLVLCQRGFVYILAVERRVIEGYLQHRYNQEYGLEDFKGETYLDKMVQLPFYIPPHSRRIETFSQKLLSRIEIKNQNALESILPIVGAAGGSNPRSTIRFVNNLLIDQAISDILSKVQGSTEIPIGYFAVTRSLQQRWRDIFAILSTTDELCQEIGNLKINDLDSYETKPGNEELVHLIKVLSADADLRSLIYSEHGKAWLENTEMRHATIEFLLTERTAQPEQEMDEHKKTGKGERMTGAVKWFNSIKGYGFLTSDDGEDIFVHYASINTPNQDLEEGQKVEFEVEETNKGRMALDVHVTE